MAKKIFKTIGGALGIGGKKKAAAPAPTEEAKTGPVITDLNAPAALKKRMPMVRNTILGGESETLG